MLRLRYGVTSRGGVNVAAVAEELGVTPRTVQKWLAGRSGRAYAHIPPKRLTQLMTLMSPGEELLRDEAVQLRRAHEALASLERPLDAWVKQHWLESHLVAVISVPELGIRQIAVTRVTDTALLDVRKRGRVLSRVEVPTRFHATILTLEVLTRIRPWRFRTTKQVVKQGFTQSWLDTAPRVDLAHIHAQLWPSS